MEWHALTYDQKRPNSDKLFVLWNGDNFVIPCTPTSVAEVNTNLSNIQENFDELKDLIKETIEMLPKSDIKTSFKDVQKMINNCSELVKSCNTSTGWADLILPKLPSVESAGLLLVSRIPTRRQPNLKKSRVLPLVFHHQKLKFMKKLKRVVRLRPSPSLLYLLRNLVLWRTINVHVVNSL